MKYQKTITITSETLEKLENGELRIQAGQWVKIESTRRKSRFVGITKSGSLWIVHAGNKKISFKDKFLGQCKSIKNFQ